MQTFEVEPIRTLSPSGTLESVGLEWTEEASWRHGHKPMMFIMALPMALFFVLAGFIMMMNGWGPIIMILSIAFLIWIFQYCFGKLPRRSVVLKRNGKIGIPHGIPENKRHRSLKARQPDIVGFEIGPAVSGTAHDWTSSVQAITQTGATITLSRFLHREEAREVVVGLNLALKEMRSSVGREPVRASRPVAARVFVD